VTGAPRNGARYGAVVAAPANRYLEALEVLVVVAAWRVVGLVGRLVAAPRSAAERDPT